MGVMQNGYQRMTPKQKVHDEYNRLVDEGNANMAWGISHANTWYRNDAGRVTQNWPFSLVRFWQQTKEVNAEDYTLA